MEKTQDKEIDNILKSANIIDIISSYIPLTQKGKNYFGVCPFHEDHSPSMSVSEEKQIYKCFSCGAAGNVFTFVKEYENVSFIEAVKIVADKCGLVFHGSVNVTTKIKKNQKEYEIMDLALKYYQNNLNTDAGKEAKVYLKERGLDDKAIKTFDLGLALRDSNNSLNKLFLSKKIDADTLYNLGLINRNGSYISDIFQDRVMFPIHDLDGNVVGFTGRIYQNNNQAKYINSKESVIFKKGTILFNYHRAKSEIKRKKEIIIVEGNMDAIRMYINGVQNVVALMGTSLTNEQVSIIKSLRAKVILMLDNDEAGESASINNGDILEKAGIKPLIVRLSGEKDPDEYIIKNGVEGIINNINNPISFLDFKLSYYKKNKDLSKTNDLVKYIKEIIDSIKDLDDELMREITIKKMSDEYDIPLELLKQELAKVVKPKDEVIVQPKQQIKKKLSKYNIACQNILYFMMNDGKYIAAFEKELGYFNSSVYRNLANEIIDYYEQMGTIDLASFLALMETKDFLYDEVMSIIKSVNLEELDMESFLDFVKAAENEGIKEEIKEIKEKIKVELDENKKIELGNKLLKLKMRMCR